MTDKLHVENPPIGKVGQIWVNSLSGDCNSTGISKARSIFQISTISGGSEEEQCRPFVEGSQMTWILEASIGAIGYPTIKRRTVSGAVKSQLDRHRVRAAPDQLIKRRVVGTTQCQITRARSGESEHHSDDWRKHSPPEPLCTHETCRLNSKRTRRIDRSVDVCRSSERSTHDLQVAATGSKCYSAGANHFAVRIVRGQGKHVADGVQKLRTVDGYGNIPTRN